jgi:hypothetical protein
MIKNFMQQKDIQLQKDALNAVLKEKHNKAEIVAAVIAEKEDTN